MEPADYERALSSSTFCLIVGIDGRALFDALKFGCVPILVGGEWVLAFDEFIDWRTFSVQMRMFQVGSIEGIVSRMSVGRVRRMEARARFVFDTYFRSMKHITLGALAALEARIYPNMARKSKELYQEKVLI